jgi:hypothetical protein
LVAHIFHIKVAHLLTDLKKKQIFGKFLSCVWTIKYQKQGLLHLHLLLFLHPEDRNSFMDPAVINRHISTKLPQPQDDPTRRLTNIMQTMIVHGPCGATNPNAPCIVAGAPGHPPTYLKRFPKPFCPATVVHNNRYPQYRRRDNSRSWPIRIPGGNGTTVNLNNRYIVPYNPYLSAKYRAHINVKACASVKAIKYINKYIYKGNDRTTVQLSDDNDKISKYLHGRYIGPTEAVWRLFKFPVYEEYPPIMHLTVHLPGQQPIYFQPDESVKDLQQRLETAHSTLTAWFRYNTENTDGHTTLYQDFPYKYTFIAKTRQ